MVTWDIVVFTGFVTPTEEKSAIIKADGSTVIEYFYEREEYTVSFDSNSGSDVDDQTVKYEATATEPTPTRDWYAFKGWFDENGIKWNFGTQITGDVNLKAFWSANEVNYTVIWHVQNKNDNNMWLSIR